MLESLYRAVYLSIIIRFLRLTRRKLLRPAPKLVMPPAAPGDTPVRLTLGAMVRTGDKWDAFMVSGAATATISNSQSTWLHHAMVTASDGFRQELSANCKLMLGIWSPELKKPLITAPALARMFGLSGTQEARFTAMFNYLVHQFNEAVSR